MWYVNSALHLNNLNSSLYVKVNIRFLDLYWQQTTNVKRNRICMTVGDQIKNHTLTDSRIGGNAVKM